MTDTIDTKIELCLNKQIAEHQRQKESEQGFILKGTGNGLEVIGCYECQGYKPMCRAYFSLEVDLIQPTRMYQKYEEM